MTQKLLINQRSIKPWHVKMQQENIILHTCVLSCTKYSYVFSIRTKFRFATIFLNTYYQRKHQKVSICILNSFRLWLAVLFRLVAHFLSWNGPSVWASKETGVIVFDYHSWFVRVFLIYWRPLIKSFPVHGHGRQAVLKMVALLSSPLAPHTSTVFLPLRVV